MSNRPPNGPRRSKRLRKAVVGSSATSSESDGSSPRYRFPDSDDAIAARPQEIEAEDKCSICLQRLQGSDLGSPGVCGHVFCLDCIVKWSMNSNTCPVDRNAFYKISVRRRPGGPVVRVIPVYPPLKLDSVHGTTCEVCASVDGLATMLICDNCARGFHLQCLRPSLEELPDVQWVCPACNTRGDASLHQILLVLNNQYRNSESSEPDDASSEEEEDEEQKRFTDHMRSEPGLFYQRLRDFVDQARTWRYLLNMVNEYDPYGEPQPSTSTGRTSGEGGSRRPLAKKCKYKRRNRTVCPDSMQVHAKVTVRNKKQEVSIYGDAPSMLRAGPPSFAEELQVTSGASLVLAAGPTSHILDAHRQARIKMASVSTLSSILDAHTVVRTRSSLLSLEGFLERIPEPRSTLERETAKMNLGRAPEKTRAAGGGYRGGGGGGPPSRPAHASPRPAHAAHRHAHAAHRPTPPAPYDPTQPTRGDSSEDDGDCPNFSVYSATSVHIAGRDDDDEADERCPVTRNARTPIKIKFNTHTLIKRPVGLYDDEEDSVRDEIDENITVAQNTSETIERVLDDIDDFEVAKVTDTNEMVTSHDVPAEKNAHGLSEEGVIVNNNGHHVNNTDDTVSDDYEDISIKEDERDGANGLFDDDLNSKKGPVCKNGEKITESISETEDERSYTPCLDENKSKDNSLEIGKENIGIEGLDTEMISEDEGNELFSDGERSDKSRHIIKREKVPRDREEGEISEKRKGLADTSNRDDTKRKKKKDSKKESKDKKLKNKKSDVVFKKLSKNGKERNYRDKVDRNNRHSSSDRDKARRKEKRKDLQRYDVRTLVGRRKQKDPFGRDVSPVRRSRTPSPRPSPMSTPYRGERRRRAFSRRSDSRGRNTISRSATPNLSSTRRSLTPSRRRSASRRRRKSISPKQRRSISLGAGRTESPRLKRSTSQRPRRSASPRTRRSASPRTRRSSSPRIKRSMSSRGRRSISKSRRKRSTSAKRKSPSPSRRRATPVRGRKRPRRSSSRTPRLKLTKKKRRSRSRQPEKRSRKNKRKSRSPRRKSPKQKKKKAAKSVSPELELSPALWPDSDDPAYAWSGGSPGLTPPRRRDPPGKEVFTSGDNILVSVSFDDEGRRRRRPRRDLVAKPVAIIDLDRSPFRELTPSPENVIVLSDSSPSPPAPAPGPKTPPSPAAPEPPAPAAEPAPYDPFEPTKSPEPAPILMTLETAQQTNMSADDVVNQRPVSPLEKVLALLQSTRDLCPAPAPYERPALPPASSPPPARPDPAPEPESPYSPGSGDFGDLFSPPAQDASGNVSAQDAFDTLFGKQSKGKDAKDRKLKKNAADESRTDEKDLEILDELPNSAVEMQVKSKFLKKLNRQERVVEEVKLVLKPHYNKKRLSKDDYKDILRRAVPKICHNKSGEINPAKIQALVEAYVRKFRKRRKLGLI